VRRTALDVMAAHSRPQNGAASLAYVAGISTSVALPV
jgi:hypothetical protein